MTILGLTRVPLDSIKPRVCFQDRLLLEESFKSMLGAIVNNPGPERDCLFPSHSGVILTINLIGDWSQCDSDVHHKFFVQISPEGWI